MSIPMKAENLITPPTRRELDNIKANKGRFKLLIGVAITFVTVIGICLAISGFGKPFFGPAFTWMLGCAAFVGIVFKIEGHDEGDGYDGFSRLDDDQVVELHKLAIESPAVALYVAEVTSSGRMLVRLDWANAQRIGSRARLESARQALSAYCAPHPVA